MDIQDATPLDDERYLAFVTRLVDSTKAIAKESGYQVDGLVALVECDGIGVTIASTLDDDDQTRRILAEGIARSHNVASRLVE